MRIISHHVRFTRFVITSTVEETTFDSDEATFDGKVSYYSGISSPSTYIGRDFGAPKVVGRIDVYGTASFSFYGKVQYSDDGTNFNDAGLVVNVAPYDSTWHSYAVPNLGPHRYWIIRDLQDDVPAGGRHSTVWAL